MHGLLFCDSVSALRGKMFEIVLYLFVISFSSNRMSKIGDYLRIDNGDFGVISIDSQFVNITGFLGISLICYFIPQAR